MRTELLCLMALLAGASLAEAQQWPAYYNGGYPQGYQQPQPSYGPPAYGSNFNYQRFNGSPYYYASNPGGNASYYSPPNPAYYAPPSNYAAPPVMAYPAAPAAMPAPPVMVESYNGYPYGGQEINPAPVGRREESVYRAPPLLDEPIPFHRPCKDLFWVSTEYLASFIRQMRLAGPLVSTGAATDPHPAAVGQPHTSVLFGNEPIDFGLSSGFRLDLGLFLDRDNHFSVDMQTFVLFQNTQTYGTASDGNGNPIIGRPFFNTLPVPPGPGNNALLNSFPGESNGSVSVEAKSLLWGMEFNARHHVYCYGNWHWESLFGLRYLRLAESLTIRETIKPLQDDGFVTFQGQGVGPPNSLSTTDSFSTINQFYGAQVGGQLSWEYKWLTLQSFYKLGLGATVEQVNINGFSSLNTPTGNTFVVPGGLLALPSNIGGHTRTTFGLVPELGINMGVDLTEHIRLQLGYSALIWNRVVRPGLEYPTSANAGQIPGSPNFGASGGAIAPTFHFSDELFWVHSFNIGLTFHF